MRFLKRFPFPLILIQTVPAKFSLIKPFQSYNQTHFKRRPNELLKEYLRSHATTKAIFLFRGLLRKSISFIDSYSILYIIKICTKKASPNQGQQFHTLIVKLGYEPIIFLQTSLIDFYSAQANVSGARQVFEEIPRKNVVCWTSLISAYVENQKPKKALELFREMQMDNVDPDQITLTVVLSACADLGALDMGKWIHDYIRRKRELNKDLSLYNALLNMYTKCGDLETAKVLFGNMEKKDVTTWTSMIMGYALHGQAKEALALFVAMTEENRSPRNIVPNHVTFIGVLMACSHAGMVEEGKRYFKIMTKDYGIKPQASHFGCIVDLLCRAGLLEEAKNFILEMPVKPNPVLWRTLLGACSLSGNVDLAEEAHRQILELEGNLAGDEVVMGNIYASKGLWDQKEVMRDQINQRRVPGRSSIEMEPTSLCLETGDVV